MAIRILRTMMLAEVVTPEHEIKRRVPVFAGDVIRVRSHFDHDDGFDWLAPVEGGLLPLPPGSWEQVWRRCRR